MRKPGQDDDLLDSLGGGDLLIIAIGTSLDAVESGLEPLGKAEGARDALLEVVEGIRKDALVHRDP